MAMGGAPPKSSVLSNPHLPSSIFSPYSLEFFALYGVRIPRSFYARCGTCCFVLESCPASAIAQPGIVRRWWLASGRWLAPRSGALPSLHGRGDRRVRWRAKRWGWLGGGGSDGRTIRSGAYHMFHTKAYWTSGRCDTRQVSDTEYVPSRSIGLSTYTDGGLAMTDPTPEQIALKARLDRAYGPPVVAVPRPEAPASVTTLADDMAQRLADDDREFARLKERIESLNLYDEFKDVVPYKNAKPRTIAISVPRYDDHALVKQILEWAAAYRSQKMYSKQFMEISRHPDSDLEQSMAALQSAMKADAQAADYRTGIDSLFKDAFKVLADLHKKRLDAALAHAAAQQKHAHHKDILASKGFGDPNSASSADLARIAGG